MRFTKNILLLLGTLLMFSCEKKKTETPEEPSTTTTTGGTTGTPPPPPPPPPLFSAVLTATNNDTNFGYTSARFFESTPSPVLIDEVKVDGKILGQVPNNEYRYTNTSSNYTAAVLWQISSSRAHIPDTALSSPAFPTLGFTKNVSLTYDKNLDFTIPLDVSGCDTMFVTLGTILKKITGKSGVTSITYKQADGVKPDLFDNTRVVIDVVSSNYKVINVRGRKWKLSSSTSAQSHYIYK
jgi:hypothetical protein